FSFQNYVRFKSMKKPSKPKIIAIVGQTSSGKSGLAVKLAKKIDGEVISADSRQVYKGLNIGSGKITKKEMLGVPHHLLDIANPKERFTVSMFKELADKAIGEILARGKVPIICGGTGFYVEAVVKNVLLPDVPVNKKLRKELSKKTAGQLFEILKKIDPKRALEIGKQNGIRLIRALEIVKALGQVPPLSHKPIYETLSIGIETEKDLLKEKIHARLLARIKDGMIAEAKKLHEKGLSWKRMEELGLEYRALARHLREELTKEEMIEELNREIYQYARRQAQWFRRDKNIQWFEISEIEKINSTVKKFLA
ncbi:TPA: tRNA (adenosine(37)-N6)-dimethylallyltransferase MiaA, partial [Candidatus Taylorbacteria bacterium]|nr:tRNA (adenosine(37)-N6)-dimethylallyltransferase MiaA [Candidatus Taylorbacteria bacterium]